MLYEVITNNGYMATVGDPTIDYNDSIKIAYEFDATGDPGYTDSYIGIQYCGSYNFV